MGEVKAGRAAGGQDHGAPQSTVHPIHCRAGESSADCIRRQGHDPDARGAHYIVRLIHRTRARGRPSYAEATMPRIDAPSGEAGSAGAARQRGRGVRSAERERSRLHPTARARPRRRERALYRGALGQRERCAAVMRRRKGWERPDPRQVYEGGDRRPAGGTSDPVGAAGSARLGCGTQRRRSSAWSYDRDPDQS